MTAILKEDPSDPADLNPSDAPAIGMKYGAIGALIGHDLTHGFDGLGRQFDATGTLRDWWTARNAREFKRRCFVREYSEFTTVDEVALNGRLTLDENIADNGGLRLAYLALKGPIEERVSGARWGLHSGATLLPGQCTD